MCSVQKCESQEDKHPTLSKTHTFTSETHMVRIEKWPHFDYIFFSYASFPVIIEPSLFLGGCSLPWTCCSVMFFRMSLIVLLSSSSAAWAEASRTSCCSFKESELISSIQLEDTSCIRTLSKQEKQLLWQSQVAAGLDWSRSKLEHVQTGAEQIQAGAGLNWIRSRLE